MLKRVFWAVTAFVICMMLMICDVSAVAVCTEPDTLPEVLEPSFGRPVVDVFNISLPQPPKPEINVITYDPDDLDLLARLITAEAGSSWLPDEIQLYVGSVVLNRMASEWYPDTLEEVIYQSGQYSPTWTGAIYNTPAQRTIDNAKYLLTHGSVLPENVVYQANFIQGSGIYYQYYDSVLGTTSYFCYRN